MTTFLTTVLQNLPHFAQYFGDAAAEYGSDDYIGLRSPSGEFAAYNRHENRWHYGNKTIGCSGETLAEAIAKDSEVGEE